VKTKQQTAEKAYAAALQAKEEARVAAVTAASEAVGLEAECAHCRAEVQAGQVGAMHWVNAKDANLKGASLNGSGYASMGAGG
jgi:hypothetical protein